MTVAEQIAALQHAAVAELAARYAEVFGHAPRSRRNAAWLRKRIAFKLQENAYGGLSRVARAALDKLTAEIVLPAASTKAAVPSTNGAPHAGRVFERSWHGQIVRAVARDDGSYEWNGHRFRSLSAVAFAVTNAKWNGRLFFNLVGRSSKS